MVYATPTSVAAACCPVQKAQTLCMPQNNLPVQGAKYTQDSYRFAANAFHQQWLSAHPEIKAAVRVAQQVRS